MPALGLIVLADQEVGLLPNFATIRTDVVKFKLTASPVNAEPQPADTPSFVAILPPIPRTVSPTDQPLVTSDEPEGIAKAVE